MNKQRQALELALEALQWNWGGEPLPTMELEAIEAIKEALAEPEQEPVAWRTFNPEGGYDFRSFDYQTEWNKCNSNYIEWVQALYAAPQASKPLTDDQIDAAWRSVDYTQPYEDFRIAIARAIERAHGIGDP